MMKRFLLPFLMAALMPVIFSCKKDNSDGSLTYVYIGTAEAENVTPTSAKLMSNIRFGNISGGKMDLCFYYSEKEFDRYEEIVDGDEIQVGDYRLKVIHTPGHTPGNICLWMEEQQGLL